MIFNQLPYSLMEKQVRTVHHQQLWEKQDPPLKQKAQQTQRTKVIRPEVRAVSWSAVDRRKHIEAAVCLGRRREQRLPALGVPHLQAETWRSWEQMVMPRSSWALRRRHSLLPALLSLCLRASQSPGAVLSAEALSTHELRDVCTATSLLRQYAYKLGFLNICSFSN